MPGGREHDNAYDNGALPPVADGRVNATGVPSTHTWFQTVQSNTGGVSGTTSIVKVSVSASLADVLPSESVTLHVHVVGPPTVLGVPLILNELRAMPRGREHDNA